MPSSAHRHLLLEFSIALILVPAALLLCATATFADETNNQRPALLPNLNQTLPTLQNTNQMDRYLSREVSDSFVFGERTTNNGNGSPPAAADSDNIAPPLIPNSNTSSASAASPGRNETALETADKSALLPLSDAVSADLDRLAAPWQPIYPPEEGDSDSVWSLIVQSQRLPIVENERVQFYEEQYRRESLWISKILHRGAPFLAHLVATLEQRFMPVELALLPAIESGYQPTAKSAGNAAGLWQIVPITAKEIGVSRNAWFDGRGDILTSTTAAIDYLSYLNAEFDGDWELTLAAYNAGPGRVRAAVRKNTIARLPTDYWSLDLPEETMNYVPKLIALVNLIKHPEQGGFDMPIVRMEPAFESIDIGFRVSVDKAAKIADIDEDLLRSLNAGLIHGVTAPEGPHHLLIPAGSGEQFQQAFANVDRKSAFSEPKTHDVAAGDSISSIALKYGLSQRALLRMNSLDNANIRIGQKLAVLDSRHLSDSAIEYVVTIGDTLSEIAHKFSVKVGDITQSNGDAISGDVIHPGDTLMITLALPSSG